MNAIDQFLQRLQSLSSGAYLPTVYDGFVEADALVESEDSILDLLRGYVHELWLNRNMLSMTEEKLALFEEKLKLHPTASQTVDDRRRAVADVVNEHFVLNDASLFDLIHALQENNDFQIDAENLILRLIKVANTQGESEADELLEALKKVQPVIPSNLATEMAVLAENDIEATAIYGWTSILETDLGTPEFVKGITHYGYLTSTGEDVSIGEIPMGGFTGGIVAQYDADLVQTTIPMGGFTGGIVAQYDADLVQTTIPMGYMQ